VKLSPSKIGTAMKCPEQFRLRYVEHVPELSSWTLLAGRVFHAVVETALKHVMAGDGLLSAMALDDLFSVEWNAEIREEEAKDWFFGWEIPFEAKNQPERLMVGYRKLVKLAREGVLPKLKPKLVEHMFEVEFDGLHGSPDFVVKGVIDLVEEDGTLSDWKTTGRVKEEKLDPQFPFYSFHVSKLTGKSDVRVQKIYMVLDAEGVRIQRRCYVVGEAHRRWFHRVAADVAKMVATGVYVMNPNGWWCSEAFCPHWRGCVGELQP